MMTYYIIILLVWNVFVFICYGVDKKRAQKAQWRIAGKTLLLQALFLGGWGALLASKIFRHKTRKWYFILTWYVGILVSVVVGYWLGDLLGWEFHQIGSGK